MSSCLDAPIRRLDVSVYRVPTDAPEADGTFEWEATTLALVELEAGDCTGLGYTYGEAAAAEVVKGTLAPCVKGRDACDLPGAHASMRRQVRNGGLPGVWAHAIGAGGGAMWVV